MPDGLVRVISNGRVGVTDAGLVSMREPCRPACPAAGHSYVQVTFSGIETCSNDLYCSSVSAPVGGLQSYLLLPHPDFPCCWCWEGDEGSVEITLPGSDPFTCEGYLRVMLRLSTGDGDPYGPVRCRLTMGLVGHQEGWCQAVPDCNPEHVWRNSMLFYYWQNYAVNCEFPLYGWRDNTISIGQCCDFYMMYLGYGGSALIEPGA